MKIMKILNYFFCATLALSVVTSANSASFKKDDLKKLIHYGFFLKNAEKYALKVNSRMYKNIHTI